ncbi:MAG: NUDIX domain-containing protein [Parcubacteria group bacterium]|jgi:isopentenyldiphosphate isomerase
MTEEFLDIVNENNILTGESAPRSKVHAEGIWHRTVHVYVFRKNDNVIEFLVHLRSKSKDLAPNKWDTRFGGHVKAGVSLEEGVGTEMKEEIGLNINLNSLIVGTWRKSDKFPNREFSRRYYFEYNGDLNDLTFNDGEVQEVQWMNIQDIKNGMENDSEKWAGGVAGFTEISDYLSENLFNN